MATASTQAIDVNAEAANYLPAVLSQRKAAHVGAVELRYVKKSDGRFLYTYYVDWQEDIEDVRRNLNGTDFSEMMCLDRVEKVPKTVTKSGISESPSDYESTTLAGTSTFHSNMLRTCDGPCRTNYPVEDLTVIGLCEHAICKKCLNQYPRAKTPTGEFGCPNLKCHMLDVATLCPDKKMRLEKLHRVFEMKSPVGPEQLQMHSAYSTMSESQGPVHSPSVSTAFERGATELHHVKVVFTVAKEVKGKPYQNRIIYSYPSTMSLGEVWTKIITEDFPELKDKHISGRRYLCNDDVQMSNRHLWTPITEKMEQKQLSVYENYGYGLNILVNLVNYSC
uniref:RING-type domain-containing protein n=1 Tax=Panagrellus redivivus TaxID=6233 RepID=A0A7E4VNF2_PANRE